MSFRVGSYDFDNYITKLHRERDQWISRHSPTGARQVGSYVDETSVVDPGPVRVARARKLLLPGWETYIPLGLGLAVTYFITR